MRLSLRRLEGAQEDVLRWMMIKEPDLLLLTKLVLNAYPSAWR